MEIYDLLKKRYPSGEYALLEEVRDKAGFSASRSADYVVVNLWPSRGMHVTGFEKKVSRSDWLNELKKPAKAENIFQYCDFFYLVTSDESIAKLEEIPQTWGWIAVGKTGKQFKTMKEAPALDPKPISRHFFAAAMKRATCNPDLIHIGKIEDKLQEAKQRATESSQRELERLRTVVTEKDDLIMKVQQVTGVLINRYSDMEKFGKVFRLLYEKGGPEQMKGKIIELQNLVHYLDNHIKIVIEQLEPEHNENQNS